MHHWIKRQTFPTCTSWAYTCTCISSILHAIIHVREKIVPMNSNCSFSTPYLGRRTLIFRNLWLFYSKFPKSYSHFFPDFTHYFSLLILHVFETALYPLVGAIHPVVIQSVSRRKDFPQPMWASQIHVQSIVPRVRQSQRYTSRRITRRYFIHVHVL